MVPKGKSISFNETFQIIPLNVGHGDATLFKLETINKKWTCLIDGGKNQEKLLEHLNKHTISEIDLLVLTHYDTDHVGGLIGLANKITIHNYWGPALSAFKRYLWLFGKRGKEAVERGMELESSLRANNIQICYPLEGYSSSPLNNHHVKLSVLSPPARLINRLISGDDVEVLFNQYPMPLAWLLQPDEERESEYINDNTPQNYSPQSNIQTYIDSNIDHHPIYYPSAETESSALQKEWALRTALEPEYFGDSVLNNTSLVLYGEIQVNQRQYRILISGDQENWIYLLLKNPKGLNADFFKAPHHGGRIYIDKELAYEALFGSIQPRVVMFSANGEHGLPNNVIRETAAKYGSTVLCTSMRNREIIIGSPDISEVNECCQKLYSCTNHGVDNVVVTIDSHGISTDNSACYTGLGKSFPPVIQIRQHIVEPSKIVDVLLENELNRYVKWINSELKNIHNERKMSPPPKMENSIYVKHSSPVPVSVLLSICRGKDMNSLVPHIKEVLSHGIKTNSFWSTLNSYNLDNLYAYILPSTAERKELIKFLRSKKAIIFNNTNSNLAGGKDCLLNKLGTGGIAAIAEYVIKIPPLAFQDTLWPFIINEFKSNWHCYYFDDYKDIVLSTLEQEIMLRAILDESESQNFSISVEDACRASVVASYKSVINRGNTEECENEMRLHRQKSIIDEFKNHHSLQVTLDNGSPNYLSIRRLQVLW